MSLELAERIAVVTGAGSGLGAAMCRRFAEAGMAVAALDIDEGGAKVTATAIAEGYGVPAMSARVDAGDAASLADAAATVGAWRGGCDVLCANVGVQQFGAIDRLTDDDWTWVISVNVLGTVRTVASFLPLLRRRSGWRRIVVTASSGEEGLAVLDERSPHVVLSDIEMPGMDGYSFMRAVRERPASRGGQIPAAALTAYARPEDRDAALRAGFQLHIAKPVQPAELAAVVSSLAGRRSGSD